MTDFDREMQDALLADAEKLRAMGVDVDDPYFEDVSDRGYWATHQDGEKRWHEAPERDHCGGSGTIHCYCGGDFCCCGNGGEIECDGCPDCESDDDYERAEGDYPDEEES